MDLLAAEITAVTGCDPGQHYQKLTEQFGDPVYERIDVAATPAQKAALGRLSPEMVVGEELAGEQITAKLTRAPYNDAAIGGLKVVTDNGWFAARPSGTEDIYKIYAESFKGADHLRTIFGEAQAIVAAVFGSCGCKRSRSRTDGRLIRRGSHMEHSAIKSGQRKRIALVAHDNKKQDLLEWAKWNKTLLIEHDWNIPAACNRASVDFMISWTLMIGDYERLVTDYRAHRERQVEAFVGGMPAASAGEPEPAAA